MKYIHHDQKVGPDHISVLSEARHFDSYKSNFKIPVSLNSYAQNIQIHTHTYMYSSTTVGQKKPSSFFALIYRQGSEHCSKTHATVFKI